MRTGEVAILAIMPEKRRRGNYFHATDSQRRSYDLKRVERPALIFVARLSLQWLKKDKKLWARVVNPNDKIEETPILHGHTQLMDSWPNEIANLKPGQLEVKLVPEYRDAIRAVDDLGVYLSQRGRKPSAR